MVAANFEGLLKAASLPNVQVCDATKAS